MRNVVCSILGKSAAPRHSHETATTPPNNGARILWAGIISIEEAMHLRAFSCLCCVSCGLLYLLSFKDKAKKLILKSAPPQESWDRYDIQVMGVFSTYAEAHAKLDRAQYISDLNSDMSDDGRRKRLPPCRLIQESEEPTIGRTKRPRVFPLPESSDSEDVDNTLPDVPPIPHNFPECHAAGKKTIARPCSSQGSNDDSIHDTISGTLDEMCGTSFAGMSGEATSHPRQHENVASTTEFQKQVLQLLHLV
ncbi:uncharacterized protein LOC135382988 [Ornithodoros turicata]|uniref:uncharacterized protein LOC135382988 n=1 Tax=Ornithodoros turicata TaxID=34597 RepID=UPI003138DE33